MRVRARLRGTTAGITHLVGYARPGRRGTCQRASADGAVDARFVHIRTLVLHGGNSVELSETCR